MVEQVTVMSARGRVIFSGPPHRLIDDPRSVTAEYLRRLAPATIRLPGSAS
jgi:hypothetical protein